MSEKLQGMVEKNIFARICVSAIDQKTKDYKGMQELTALYSAMNWISVEEVAEILEYAKTQFEVMPI